MEGTIRKNEKCFIGLPSCGYGFESAKMCFVACPSDEKYTFAIEMIKNLVESKQYECHIALKKLDPGNFVFCTKICSKIIQSQFCIVILDPSISEDEKTEYPNPNVHLEYGMMMSQNKYVIPLQNEKYDLPFNISPLDTIKYTESTLKEKLSAAIDIAIKIATERQSSAPPSTSPDILTFYNLSGFVISDIRERFLENLYKLGGHLGFFLFNSKRNEYKYIGPFDNENPPKVILHTRLLMENLISTYKGAISNKGDDVPEEAFDYLVRNVSIDLITSPRYKKEDMLAKIREVKDREFQYPINIYYRSDLSEAVEAEYKRIGDILPAKNPTT